MGSLRVFKCVDLLYRFKCIYQSNERVSPIFPIRSSLEALTMVATLIKTQLCYVLLDRYDSFGLFFASASRP